jgi:hypothetical protein
MQIRKRVLAGLALALFALPLAAHHGTAASYDQSKWVPIKGTVTQYLWRNPHSALFLDVKDDSGKVIAYTIEMYSPGLMVKAGYNRTSFKVGDTVLIQVHPSLAGEPVGECLGCKILINGKDPTEKKQ